MKKYMRVSIYRPGDEPVTMVQPEEAFNVPIEQAATSMRQGGYPLFQDIEIFEGPDDQIEATISANERAQTRLTPEERHAGTLHDWAVSLLAITRPGGLVQTTQPTPLNSDTMVEVLLSVAANEQYQDQVFSFESADGETVELSGGRVVVID